MEERGWIETIGHRESPGRPALFATTSLFLDDLGLKSLADLPPLTGEEPKGEEFELFANELEEKVETENQETSNETQNETSDVATSQLPLSKERGL